MPKHKFPEAEERLFSRVFICMNCGARKRGDLVKLRVGKLKCRRCKSKHLRAIHREHK